MADLEELDTDSVVYRLDSFEGPTPIHAPSRAKSKFAEEHNVSYNDLRATVEEVDGQHYVVIGECR